MKIKFITMDVANFEGLFPGIPLPARSKIARDDGDGFGMIWVEARGWDPCIIKDGAPIAVFFQDAKVPVWKCMTFEGEKPVNIMKL